MYSPSELAQYTLTVGDGKVNRKFLKVLVSSCLAGMFIGLGYYTNILINANAPIGDSLVLNKFLGAVLFCVGLIMVIIAGADLFTGNCLVMFGVFDKRYKFSKVIGHLLIVLLGNLIGSLFLVFLVYFSNMESSSIVHYINITATAKLNLTFLEGILRGILCNIIVAIAVYMAYAAKNVSGKVIVSMVPITAFVILGFEHSVANMFLLPLNLLYGGSGVIDILGNLIPVIIGNFIGGGIIIPLAYSYLYLKK